MTKGKGKYKGKHITGAHLVESKGRTPSPGDGGKGHSDLRASPPRKGKGALKGKGLHLRHSPPHAHKEGAHKAGAPIDFDNMEQYLTGHDGEESVDMNLLDDE